MVCSILAGIHRNFYLYSKMELPEHNDVSMQSYFIMALWSHDQNELRKQLKHQVLIV